MAAGVSASAVDSALRKLICFNVGMLCNHTSSDNGNNKECENGQLPDFLRHLKTFSSMKSLDAESALAVAKECLEQEAKATANATSNQGQQNSRKRPTSSSKAPKKTKRTKVTCQKLNVPSIPTSKCPIPQKNAPFTSTTQCPIQQKNAPFTSTLQCPIPQPIASLTSTSQCPIPQTNVPFTSMSPISSRACPTSHTSTSLTTSTTCSLLQTNVSWTTSTKTNGAKIPLFGTSDPLLSRSGAHQSILPTITSDISLHEQAQKTFTDGSMLDQDSSWRPSQGYCDTVDNLFPLPDPF
ncbi:flocculation protein FLO11-like isoform X2 [Pecten maximus]|uniref:flocculation protein FLO11-like isoform X2 n=1 Tax=Pecten maximus TaxID=6579 RepID=UPI001458254E|nr:flocculation protein FLO11-like isoform X2 [Pecten maximus]